MSRINKIFLVLLVSLSICRVTSSALAQTDEEKIDQLRQQIEELESQANQYRSSIEENQSQARTLKQEISLLQNQINKIQAQINLTDVRIGKTQVEIGGLEEEIFDTQEKMDYQKASIGQLILYLHRQDEESLLAILLKNPNISDFFRQTQYSANVSTSLLDLIEDLKEEKNNLKNYKNELEGKKSELEELSQNQIYQRISFSEVKGGKDNLLKTTKGEEAKYQELLVRVEKQKSDFFNELRELELKVISGGFFIVKIMADNIPPKGTKLFRWPEDNYVLTQGYGYTSFARRGAYGGAAHNGIDISGGFGTPIKAIGDGQIVANGTNDGWGNWVAIKHSNNMVSVYGHMSSLAFIKVGTNIPISTIIGYEGSTGNSTGSHLHLSLYADFFTYLNEKNGQLYFNYFEGSINPINYLY